MSERLKGKRILVTRPEEQAENICRLIEEEGGVAIRLPVIEIKPAQNDTELREFLAGISDYDIGIFVSQNAVKRTLEILNKDVHALHNLHVIAIGKSTAHLLKQAGISNVEYTDGVATSEKLLQLPVFSSRRVKGTKVIIIRGVGGREYLAERLSEMGAHVDYAEVYRRIPCRYDNRLLENIFLGQKPDYIIVTSTEGLQNLFDMLSSQQRDILLNTQLLVLGERMAEHAIKLGFSKKPVVANETSDLGLFRAIIHSSGDADR